MIRDTIRDSVVSSLGALTRSEVKRISFPYYHSVEDNELSGFKSHLKWYRNRGDVISMKDYAYLKSHINADKRDRYFVLTFDDGLSSVFDNAVDIALALDASFTVYLICNKLEGSARKHDYLHQRMSHKNLFGSRNDIFEFIDKGFDIGSHTITHRRLKDVVDWKAELTESKIILEDVFNYEIKSFAFPWGRFKNDFTKDQLIYALSLYDHVCITNRPMMKSRFNNRIVRRDNVLANWSTNQLKFFLSE